MPIDPGKLYREAFKSIRTRGFDSLVLEAEEEREEQVKNLREVAPSKRKVIDEDLVQETAATRHRVAEAVRARLDFRLVGWVPRGATAGKRLFEKVDSSRDIETSVRRVEAKYVVDPLQLKTDFESAMTKQPVTDAIVQTRSMLSEQGFHAYLASLEKLERVRREGVIVSAELVAAKSRLPVGYCYALDKMPMDDPEFPNLSYSTVGLPDDLKTLAIPDPYACQAIWRTTVEHDLPSDLLPEFKLGDIPPNSEFLSLRRMAIGSALKYIVIQLARARGKILSALNVGKIIYTKDTNVQLPNSASYVYNNNILKQLWGIRNVTDDIMLQEHGGRETIAKVAWMTLGDTTDAAIQRLEEENGPLLRHQFHPAELQVYVREMLELLRLDEASA